MTIRWERCAFSRASSTKHSWPNGHLAAPRQSRWPTLTCRHSRSVCAGRVVALAAAALLGLLLGPGPQLEDLLAQRARRHLDQRALVVGHALADPVQAGVVGAALEHGVRRVDLVADRLDQPRDVALDQLVLERERRGRDHDPLVVQQARHQVGQRLAGAGAGLHQQVLAVVHRPGDGLGHGDLAVALGAAERGHRGREHLAHGAAVGGRRGVGGARVGARGGHGGGTREP